MKLPSQQSAYAIDLEPESGLVAVGTRGGLVLIAEGPWHENHAEPIKGRELFQGAPVLSVCWCGDSLLSVSDSAGRTMMWRNNPGAAPYPLEASDAVICSLLKLPNGILSGFSSKGKLLLWQIPEGQLVQTIDLPAPPFMSGLVRMLYWPAGHSLVCPGAGGRLSLCDLEDFRIRHIEAHQGDLYAISLWDEGLVTAGIEDGRLKLWIASVDKPVKDLRVPKGIVSLAVTGFLPARILLAGSKGTVFSYILDKDNLKVTTELSGKDYRIVAAQDPNKIRVADAKKKEAEAHLLLNRIQENIGRVPEHVMEDDHARLVSLGYKHISLRIRAEQAEISGNIVEALGLFSSLMDLLPQNHPNSFPCMDRYATMLEKSWHITEAEAVSRRILNVNPEYPLTVKKNDLNQIARLIEGESWIIEPDIPVDSIIESATILGKYFTGKYVLKKLSAKSCAGMRLTPKIVASKYGRIRAEIGNGGLPEAKNERLWWISKTGFDELELVILEDGSNNGLKELKFALQVLCDDRNSLIVPVVLFDWIDKQETGSVEEANRKAFRALSRIRESDLSNIHLASVHRALEHTLRRLVTENRPNGRTK